MGYERVGEDEVYDHFRAKGELSSDLCFRETRDCQVGAELPHKQKKDKKTSTEATKSKPVKTNAKGGSTEATKSKPEKSNAKADKVDVSTFISQLAKKHGLATSDYTKKRTFAEWEEMFSLVTQRIAEKQHDQVLEV